MVCGFKVVAFLLPSLPSEFLADCMILLKLYDCDIFGK